MDSGAEKSVIPSSLVESQYLTGKYVTLTDFINDNRRKLPLALASCTVGNISFQVEAAVSDTPSCEVLLLGRNLGGKTLI